MYFRLSLAAAALSVLLTLHLATPLLGEPRQPAIKTLNVKIPHISTDRSVKYDYDIVYVRAKRAGDKIHKRFYTDIATPVFLEPGADLMLLHPDGKEELLVKGGEGAVTDPSVSLDGEWVYYTLIHSLKGADPWEPAHTGADIYKMHVKTRRIVRLTHQQFTPNTGAAAWSAGYRTPQPGRTHVGYGVQNFGAYPLPGGRIIFTSNRNAFRPPRGYPPIALQLFVMDDDGSNVEQIGYLNVAGALHPVVLRDGRVIFSSLESQGTRTAILWGIWSIHPDGTNWGPIVSAFDPIPAANAFHFQTQLSDGSIVVEGYYNQNNSGFGSYIKLPEKQPYPGFGPGYMRDQRNKPWVFGSYNGLVARTYRKPFMPAGSESLTRFARMDEGPADFSNPRDKNSPRVGKFTHPSGAPNNHLLTIYSPGPVNHQYAFYPQIDGGIYLIKDGKPIDEPAQMLLIKNDPNYNEQWPRALVSYERIYGVKEPKRLVHKNDGKKSPLLPEGTPYGLVGTSSLYKRESYPNGVVPAGSVTATYAGGPDPWKGLGSVYGHNYGIDLNWHHQGADAALYTNEEIHAIRILAMEPTTDRNRGDRAGRLFLTHASERLRILGEIPVRKFGDSNAEPADPDGNPDTSFLARIPADVPFTFQTLDKDGMVLNMAQTWHQLRPGEIRNDCGGCHAHSQKPTLFADTEAAKKDYVVWDLVERTPLLTDKARDQSKRKWDADNQTGLRFVKGVKNVEYHRDIVPIFERSCLACHTVKASKPAGNLALDGPDERAQGGDRVPSGYYRLALDATAKYGHKPIGRAAWVFPQMSRYVRFFQSRRSLLAWKILGKRLDGFSNDDHPSETIPGSGTLAWKGKPVDFAKFKDNADIDFVGSVMPPPEAVKAGKVKPLSDEDRRTIARWIDLGCPLDLDYNYSKPERRGYGFACDDSRPTLTVTYPAPGRNSELTRILIGMDDYYSGLDMTTFSVYANFAVDGIEDNTNLASYFKRTSRGVWEFAFRKPIHRLDSSVLVVWVRDEQGNITRIERTFSVGKGR